MSDGAGSKEGRIRGVVGGDSDTPFFCARITVEGRPREFRGLDAFPIENESREILVEVNSFTQLLPERSVKGDFGDLLDDPLTELVIDQAPGDHVHAEIAGNLVSRGNEVVVFGELRYSKSSDGGYREAPTQHLSSIFAHVIAIGDEGDALIDDWLEDQSKKEREAASKSKKQAKSRDRKQAGAKKPSKDPLAPGPRPLFLLWCFALPTIALFAYAIASGLPTFYAGQHEVLGSTVPWLLATSGLAITTLIWRRRRWMPAFHTVNRGGSGKGERWSVGGEIMLGTMLLLLSTLGLGFLPVVSCYLSAALCLYVPIAILWKDQKNANKALALVRAKPLSADLPDKRFGRVEGDFEGVLDYRRDHETHSSSRTVTRTDSDGNSYQTQETSTWVTWKEQSDTKGEARLLRVEAEPIELELRGAEWAAAQYEISYPSKAGGGLGSFLAHMPKNYAKRIARAQRRGTPRLCNRARNGDSVLAAARVRRGDDGSVVFQVTGPGSLMLFTAPKGQSAKALLQRHLLAHYLGLALAVSAVVLPIFFVLSW